MTARVDGLERLRSMAALRPTLSDHLDSGLVYTAATAWDVVQKSGRMVEFSRLDHPYPQLMSLRQTLSVHSGLGLAYTVAVAWHFVQKGHDLFELPYFDHSYS